jgi:PTS system cellobiose-specific IIC component
MRLGARLKGLSSLPELQAVQWALPWSFGGLIVGLTAFIAAGHGTFFERLYASFSPAFGVMSFVLVVLLAVDLSRRRALPPVPVAGGALAAFVLSLPFRSADGPMALLRGLGSSGLFLAMIAAFAVAGAVRFGRARLGAVAGTAAGVAGVVAVAGALCSAGFSAATALAALLEPLAHLGDSLTAFVILIAIETLAWTVGIHGPALLAPVVLPVYLGLQSQNTEALAHGLPLPHIVTVSLFLYVFPGGAGATLPLVLLLLRSKIKRVRTVAYASLVPAIFNANEPLMFGLPLVLNPVLAVPFVLVPCVLGVVSYAAVAEGLVARPALYIPSSVPAFVNVFLATKDWRSCVLVACNILIGLGIYAPFVAAYERRELARENVES